jgi:hypothetical protein
MEAKAQLFHQSRESAVQYTMIKENCSRESAEQVVDLLTDSVNQFLTAWLERNKAWQN